MKTLNDFIWWLEVSGLLQLYFSHAQSQCNNGMWILSDHIKNMDANDHCSLFEILKDCVFWDEPKEKYINWLNKEANNQ